MLEGARYSTTASSASTATSGSGRRGGGGGGARRVRVVRLVRARRAAPPFGFSLRGGREHAAGFFVTKVELDSAAHHQGLQTGDRLISVNGYRVEDAVHSELTHYIANQTRLKLKVRNVGMIPVKDSCLALLKSRGNRKSHEPLSWRFVSDATSLASDGTASSSPTLRHERDACTAAAPAATDRAELRLSVLVPPKAKLGCGICKGPEWKPGIYVQFVKDHGIAREAGLRAGDQILSCNGVDFRDMQFSEAISTMKQFPRLELRVRPGAGAELVSPESSGYSSSASSAAGGEHSPHAPDKRLSIVAEEAADFKDRLKMNRLKRRTWDSIDFDWRSGGRDGLSHSFDAPSDIEPDYDGPSVPDNPHTYDNHRSRLQREFVSSPANRTVINLTESGATIECYDHRPVNKALSDATPTRRREAERKTIVVEVHGAGGKLRASGAGPATVESRDRCSDTTSVSSNTTLSSAIAEEIMRRKMKKSAEDKPVAVPAARRATLLKPADDEQQRQHDALMDEFKKVHRKMFCAQPDGGVAQEEGGRDGKEGDRHRTPSPSRSSTHDDSAQSPPPAFKSPAPPPPPMPTAENGDHNTKFLKDGHDKVPAVNGINGKSNPTNGIANGTLKRTPTPDYEATNLELLAARMQLSRPKGEAVEVDSIESYRMRDPSSPPPKPPATYFKRPPNGTATMKRSGRPVSVTIGEYPSRARREPARLDFLGAAEGAGGAGEVGSRLQSELALTLSRSNLRRRTELLAKKLDTNGNIALESSISSDESEQDADKNFQKRYGHNMLPTAPAVAIPKVPLVKSNSHAVSPHIASLAGRVAAAPALQQNG